MSDRRRERIRRLIAKRPPTLPQIVVTHEPSDLARDRLAVLLLELLDGRRGGGGQ